MPSLRNSTRRSRLCLLVAILGLLTDCTSQHELEPDCLPARAVLREFVERSTTIFAGEVLGVRETSSGLDGFPALAVCYRVESLVAAGDERSQLASGRVVMVVHLHGLEPVPQQSAVGIVFCRIEPTLGKDGGPFGEGVSCFYPCGRDALADAIRRLRRFVQERAIKLGRVP